MEITKVTQVTDEVYAAFQRLIPQLSTSAVVPTRDQLVEIVANENFFIARDGEGQIIGMLTLVVFRIPTGVRSWIEDVVVDTTARGQGAGEALTRSAVEYARTAGAKTVDLSSRPAREAANRLYVRCGFVKRETNMYRYDFKGK
jgi:ribosomal protein S18 acetylase RimI-like enzyme